MKKIVTPFLFVTLFIILLLAVPGSAIAQDVTSSDKDTNVLSDDLILALNQSNAKVSQLMSLITLVATIFGVVVAIFFGFAAYRQYLADREIREYKDTVKAQTKHIRNEAARTENYLKNIQVSAKEKEKQLADILGEAKSRKSVAQEEIESIRKEIEDLKDRATFARGRLSGYGDSSVFTGEPVLDSDDFRVAAIRDQDADLNRPDPSIIHNRGLYSFMKTCSNCGGLLTEAEKSGSATLCDECSNQAHPS